MPPRTARTSTGTLPALALVYALQMTGLAMIAPLFPRRFESFGAGLEALGLSAMAFALTGTLAAPFIGMLADRFGRRPVILLSLASCVLAFSGFLLASSAGLLILLRALAGAFTAGLVPAVLSSVGDLAASDRRARWIGLVNGGGAAGFIAGPVLGGQLYDRFGYAVPFGASVALALGALLLAFFRVPETSTHSAPPGGPRLDWRQVFQALPAGGTFALVLLVSFGVMLAYAFVEPQFMFYAYDDLGWTSSGLGLAMGAFGLAFMLGELGLGQLSDRLGRKPVLVLGLALFSAHFAGLLLFREMAWILACLVLAGLGNALYDPSLSALLLDMAPPDQTARLMGLKSTAASLGSMLGPGLLVLLTPLIAARVVFLLSAGLVWVLVLAVGLALPAPGRSGVERAGPGLALPGRPGE